MPIKYDVVAVTGRYQKNGEDKIIRRKVGVVIEKNGNFYLKMEHLVTIDDENKAVNFFSLYQPKQNNKPQQPQQPQHTPQQQVDADFDDDIPF